MHGGCGCMKRQMDGGGCPKCGAMASMPMPMPMPMMGPAPSMKTDVADQKKMRAAAKQLLSKLQDLDFDKVQAFDMKIVMSGDEDVLEDLAEAASGEDSEEAVADSNVATLEDAKDEEEDKG
jgi:hypothetical protein